METIRSRCAKPWPKHHRLNQWDEIARKRVRIVGHDQDHHEYWLKDFSEGGLFFLLLLVLLVFGMCL